MSASLRSVVAVLIFVTAGNSLAAPGLVGSSSSSSSKLPKEEVLKLQILGVHWDGITSDREFCLQDSDQDGMSNGMELGGE